MQRRTIRTAFAAATLLAVSGGAAIAQSPTCQGEDLIAKMQREEPARYRAVLDNFATLENGEGIFWKIEKPGIKPSYLIGTAHVTDQRELDLLLAVEPKLKQARALIVRNRTQVRDELLAAGPKLEAVGRLGVGLDNIDLAACAARGVTVCPATGANAISVAECAITAAMILLRGAYMKTSEVIAGTWPRDQSAGREMWGKTLGIVGLGSIGRQTALRGRALGMTVVACDPLLAADDEAWALAEPMAMMPLLAASDVVSLHVPHGAVSGTRRR